MSCIILVVDCSSTVDSVRPCTVYIGPSPPCQTQAKDTAVHYLKHTQEATSAFSNCQHNKHLNVYIFQCCAYRNCLPVAQEFYLVCPNHCYFFCFLCLPSLFHPFLFFFVVFIDTYANSASFSANQEQLMTMKHVFPKPQFLCCCHYLRRQWTHYIIIKGNHFE